MNRTGPIRRLVFVLFLAGACEHGDAFVSDAGEQETGASPTAFVVPDASALPSSVTNAAPASPDAGLDAAGEDPDGGRVCVTAGRSGMRDDDAGVDEDVQRRFPFCNVPDDPCDDIWSTERCFCDEGTPGRNLCEVGGTWSHCKCD